MTGTILQLIENILIVYFSLFLLFELVFFFVFIFDFVRRGGYRSSRQPAVEIGEEYGISILVPAYNEAVSIRHCLELLIQLDYPHYEVVVINDGSKDETLTRALSIGDFTDISYGGESALITRTVHAVYRHKSDRCDVFVIDKENGGKADSLNAGLNISKYPYVCTIDADSILDGRALRGVIVPFINNAATIIAGGELAVLNDTTIIDGKLQAGRFPSNILVVFQIAEYIKSFMVSRFGLSRLKGLLVMSGAFSVFRKSILLRAGGFLSESNRHPTIMRYFESPRQTVCEDLEIVIRMKRYSIERKIPARVTFLPHPVCWTEVPERLSQLSRQRERWHRGLGEALFYHRSVMFDPFYRSLGLIAMPYYLVFEWLSPLVKVIAMAFLVIMLVVDMLHGVRLLMLFISITFGAALMMSLVTVVVENWSIHRSQVNRDALRYRGMGDWLKLVFYSIISDFSYSYLRIVWQMKGMLRFFQGEKSWNKFSRRGVTRLGGEE